MKSSFVSPLAVSDHRLWQEPAGKRTLLSLELEITARCNNNCRHCYINLPAGDPVARSKEPALPELTAIIDEAGSLGALWCLVTGGEPLLRKDFAEIYLYLKKKGLLVSVFTNATLLTPAHIELFKRYPPRELEVTVYGADRASYERVTRAPGSFEAFRKGLGLLFRNNVRTRLKTMALRSNIDDMRAVARFCRKHAPDHFRFDPFLHLRLDRNRERNREIKSERLSPSEIVDLERSDRQRFQALKNLCHEAVLSGSSPSSPDTLFRCGAGRSSLTVGCNGRLRICSALCDPDCVYDIKSGNLTDAWSRFVPVVLAMRSDREAFTAKCRICPLFDLCMWCPAHAYLETGSLDRPVDYFCETAHARAAALGALGVSD